jgi:YD repeat-containing protein
MKLKLTKDLMKKLRVREDTIKFISDYNLTDYPFDKLEEIEGDYCGAFRELKSYKNIKATANKVTYNIVCPYLSTILQIENSFKNNKLIKSAKVTQNGMCEEWHYNEDGALTLHKKPDNQLKQFNFDEKGKLLSIVENGKKIEYWNYNNDGQVIYHYHFGKWEKYTYDNQGREIFYETDKKYFRKSDWKGNKLTVENSRGQIDKYTYDESGNVILYTDVINDSTIEYTYDDYGNEIYRRVDSRGYTSWQRNKYDSYGNKVYCIDNSGREEHYTYNSSSQLLSYKDNRNCEETYVYNEQGILLEKNINDGIKTEYLMQSDYFIVKKNNKIKLRVPLKYIIK